jgi:hypothetical protein
MTDLIQAGIDYRMENLKATCPGEHEPYDPPCSHGATFDPCLVGLRFAALRLEALSREVADLRELLHVGADLGNHHNAATCPYCRPDLDKWHDAAKNTGKELLDLRAQLAASEQREEAALRYGAIAANYQVSNLDEILRCYRAQRT